MTADNPAARWTPPVEIESLDEDALGLVDEFIRALAAEQGTASEPVVAGFDPYAEANLGWLRAAHEQTKDRP